MHKRIGTSLLLVIPLFIFSQNRMTPELLWKLDRVSGLGISKDGKWVVFSVSTPNLQENKSNSKFYLIPVNGGDTMEINTCKI